MSHDQGPSPTAAPVDPRPSPPTPEGAGRSALRNSTEWILIGATAIVFAVLVKTFLLQAFYIPSESMNPTLKTNDRVLVNKLSYRLHGVHRGDVVVFKSLPGEGASTRDLIKRVIGLPGETVEARNGHVFVDGRPLKEDYLKTSVVTDRMPSTRIPAGHYWMMGDSRGNSHDSRDFGPIPRSAIIGRAFVRVWPLSKLGRL